MTISSQYNCKSFNGENISIGQTVYQIFEKGLTLQLMRGKVIEIKDNGILKLIQVSKSGNLTTKNEWDTPSSKVHTNALVLLESWLQGKYEEAHYKLPAHIQQLHKYIKEEITTQMNSDIKDILTDEPII